jgi:hypothetical protein
VGVFGATGIGAGLKKKGRLVRGWVRSVCQEDVKVFAVSFDFSGILGKIKS